MFVGVSVQVASVLAYRSEPDCKVDFTNRVYGTMMYGAYLWLFVYFALDRFVWNPPEKKQKAVTETAKKSD